MTAHFPRNPWEIVSIDIMGLYQATYNNNRYVIVCEDVFTKWLEAKASKKSLITDITRFLDNDVFSRFGYPSVVISDNGPQFLSSHWNHFCTKHNIRHLTTAIYHQRSNPVECRNQELKKETSEPTY
ncbi:hypothetical protein NQ314_011313 [Rhamnusium bicolor]|uniref:Integrase catalytic domain-containing protein n=1 Tax=Rhamnusium bicolor TaxID=1586634 RepID=A0AAV8XJV5_9CUCU|nr:hypothetical protein NQ314_011313 [Rhamnusium bicolor]